MTTTPTAHFDPRFSQPESAPLPWDVAHAALRDAELYWVTTVRADGRPHVVPLVGVWDDDAFVFCTGPAEQKARNLEAHADVAVTTGNNTWQDGVDVVVEGTAARVTGRPELQRLADAYFAKYGEDWHFEAADDTFGLGDDAALVFRVTPSKVIAFAKKPHGQTTYRF